MAYRKNLIVIITDKDDQMRSKMALAKQNELERYFKLMRGSGYIEETPEIEWRHIEVRSRAELKEKYGVDADLPIFVVNNKKVVQGIPGVRELEKAIEETSS
jgi:hypothetical protein